MAIKKILFIIALFCTTTFVGAQDSLQYTPVEKSLLWEITHPDIDSTSYLYGTIHIIPSKDFFITPATSDAFSSCSQVTFEIDMKDMENPMTMLPMLMGMFMKNDTLLSDLITKEEYNEVSEHFKNSDLPLPMSILNKVKPMFLTMLDPEALSGIQGEEAAGGSTSYEMYFMEQATLQHKTTNGLETVAYQMSLFDAIPYKIQADMLVASISSPQNDSTAIDQNQLLVDIYKQQDIQAMQSLVEDSEDTSNYEDILLTQRNKNWIPLIGKMMRQQTTFFAVGAGHLGGEQGVIALLRKEGFIVTPK